MNINQAGDEKYSLSKLGSKTGRRTSNDFSGTFPLASLDSSGYVVYCSVELLASDVEEVRLATHDLNQGADRGVNYSPVSHVCSAST